MKIVRLVSSSFLYHHLECLEALVLIGKCSDQILEMLARWYILKSTLFYKQDGNCEYEDALMEREMTILGDGFRYTDWCHSPVVTLEF